jgi:hypothetical protein
MILQAHVVNPRTLKAPTIMYATAASNMQENVPNVPKSNIQTIGTNGAILTTSM